MMLKRKKTSDLNVLTNGICSFLCSFAGGLDLDDFSVISVILSLADVNSAFAKNN